MSDPFRRPVNCLRAAKLDPDLPLGIHSPKRQGDVGFDLEAMEQITIAPGEAIDVPVNCRLQLAAETWAAMLARSSIAKRGLQVDAGIIDNGYRGPIFVVLRNMNGHSVRVEAGERIAQLVVHRLQPIWLAEVESIDTRTERAEDGFGSTGR